MKKLFFLNLAMSVTLSAATALQITEYETVAQQQIPKSAILGTTPLKRIGMGIRQKKIIFVNVNVYQAILFGSDSWPTIKSEQSPLDKLLGMKACALHLQLLRPLKAQEILKGFDDALKKNGVKDSIALNEFKSAIKNGGNVAKGQSVTISIDKDNSLMTCEQGGKIVHIKGNEQLFREVLSIWFGEPADLGLKALKENLTKT